MLMIDGDTLLWTVLYINNEILYMYVSNIGRSFNDKNNGADSVVTGTDKIKRIARFCKVSNGRDFFLLVLPHTSTQ